MFGLKKETRVHFIGIGGIGMSGIAEVLLSLGHRISGSDIGQGPALDKLGSLGATIFLGHQKDNVEGADLVVYSSAITPDNPEREHARELGIPEIQRAEMLAEIMRLKYGVAIAGTHGKTTTTSMLATILLHAGRDPTYIIGGIVKNLGKHSQAGEDELLIAEADESDGSFLYLNPIVSVITNIDLDHLDFYQTEEKLLDAFLDFANKAPFYGRVILNAHDIRIKQIINQVKRPFISFALENRPCFLPGPTHMAKDLKASSEGSQFAWWKNGVHQGFVELKIAGEHNVLNALGAMAAASQLGVHSEDICKGIAHFRGVGRRMELVKETATGAKLVDDYGHHPTEIRETIKALKQTNKDLKLAVIFQPHRYSRTQAQWGQFLHCFDGAEHVELLPIYPASEEPIEGITSQNMVSAIKNASGRSIAFLPEDHLEKKIEELLQRYQLVATLGAGSIGKLVRQMSGKIS